MKLDHRSDAAFSVRYYCVSIAASVSVVLQVVLMKNEIQYENSLWTWAVTASSVLKAVQCLEGRSAPTFFTRGPKMKVNREPRAKSKHVEAHFCQSKKRNGWKKEVPMVSHSHEINVDFLNLMIMTFQTHNHELSWNCFTFTDFFFHQVSIYFFLFNRLEWASTQTLTVISRRNTVLGSWLTWLRRNN